MVTMKAHRENFQANHLHGLNMTNFDNDNTPLFVINFSKRLVPQAKIF